MRAIIVQEVDLVTGEVGEVAALPNRIPLMKLEDGTIVEAYDCHRFIALGTEGEAEYDYLRRLWTFIPDDEDDDE